jgi:hypothetical protein
MKIPLPLLTFLVGMLCGYAILRSGILETSKAKKDSEELVVDAMNKVYTKDPVLMVEVVQKLAQAVKMAPYNMVNYLDEAAIIAKAKHDLEVLDKAQGHKP